MVELFECLGLENKRLQSGTHIPRGPKGKLKQLKQTKDVKDKLFKFTQLSCKEDDTNDNYLKKGMIVKRGIVTLGELLQLTKASSE